MSRLAIVRHGKYGSDYRLNDQGRAQIQTLAERLNQSFDYEQEIALVLSSIAPRAIDTAEIIAQILQAPVETHELLWSENSHPENLEEAYKLVQSSRNRADLLVLVTHYEYTEELPALFGRRDLSQRFYQHVKKGEGIILNYRDKYIARI